MAQREHTGIFAHHLQINIALQFCAGDMSGGRCRLSHNGRKIDRRRVVVDFRSITIHSDAGDSYRLCHGIGRRHTESSRERAGSCGHKRHCNIGCRVIIRQTAMTKAEQRSILSDKFEVNITLKIRTTDAFYYSRCFSQASRHTYRSGIIGDFRTVGIAGESDISLNGIGGIEAQCCGISTDSRRSERNCHIGSRIVVGKSGMAECEQPGIFTRHLQIYITFKIGTGDMSDCTIEASHSSLDTYRCSVIIDLRT